MGADGRSNNTALGELPAIAEAVLQMVESTAEGHRVKLVAGTILP